MAPPRKKKVKERTRKERAFNSSPAQHKRRAQRNKARRKAIREGRVRKGDGKEIHHPNAKRTGNLGKSTRVLSKKANRKIQPKRGGKK